VLLVYVAAAFTVQVPWGTVIASTLLPSISFERDYLLVVVAVFGTTISPYLFFWQTSQEAEEVNLRRKGLRASRDADVGPYDGVAVDTWVGMAFSNLIAFFIIVTTGATLHANGITHIETAAQAADALRPVAGEWTFMLFAAGIIGTGLLAVPVLAGSSAYAVAETFGLSGSLELPVHRALGFYTIVGAATLGGAALSATAIDPITWLFWSAVINGIVAVPIMFAMMLVISSGRSIPLPRGIKLLGLLATLLMSVSVALLFWSSLS
jgi:Mn2+/Fe2+ NRAMP family transporter